MKKLKKKVKIILLILIVCSTVVPFITNLFKVYEGMDYDMKDKNVKMDAAEITALGGKKKYVYCLGGDIKCPSGVKPTSITTYTDRNGATHNIYDFNCGDCDAKDKTANGKCKPGTIETVKCEMGANAPSGNIVYGDPEKHELIQRSGDDFTPQMSKSPDNFIPWNISGGDVYLYNPDNITIDASFSACYLYESKEECDKKLKGVSQEKDTSVKCIADNGAKMGDPLCCGQDGVLKTTKYNCLSEYPKCIGYKCGETWGKCTKSEK